MVKSKPYQNQSFKGLDKENFMSVQLQFISYRSILTFVMGAQTNRLIDTVRLSTHNICFGS